MPFLLRIWQGIALAPREYLVHPSVLGGTAACSGGAQAASPCSAALSIKARLSRQPTAAGPDALPGGPTPVLPAPACAGLQRLSP